MTEYNTSGHYKGQPNTQPPKPKVLDGEALRIAELRAAVCETCEYNNKMFRTAHFIAVDCEACGCGNRLIDRNPCPIDLHPE